ncbi:putative membrane protein [Candidatus Protofrankia californiensis]|uniref:Putative membrane protein n=1 Tax=Candidatus Protofrankia californiensis TaxID=1839754 RepID=A0A1C3PEX8_9ACTN|nr:putative membrane protein [Candidatus Protofrankia californiensis]
MDRPVPASLSHLSSRLRTAVRGQPVWLVFVGLLLLTASSSWFAESESSRGVATTAFLMTVVALKIHLVGMHFMELRYAPLALKLAFHGWIAVVWGLIVGFS